ncbi:MAG: chromosomal replication initiator protein DnaA [Proteobacteria bacterium]|nr:chromosomal replication initiator protein DnaA [Pseudomonadota bacterium]
MNPPENITKSWNNFITSIKENLDNDEIEAWVNRLLLIRFQTDLIIIGGVNQFFCNWIKEHHYKLLKDHLLACFTELQLDPEFDLVIQVWKQNQETRPVNEERIDGEKLSEDGLNPLFHFNNFVNGSNSDIAYAAAVAVGDNVRDNKYNPLFICGDVGLGKTHLIQAIGIRAKTGQSGLRIQYTNSERFTNEVINGIRFRNIQDVRNKYRHIDLLLIDDIQFLENKESTQEEFFHIFNELIQGKKQIIITADRYPREIKNLQERLVNRFNSGMVARIGKPDFETRVAIIRNRVEQMKVPLNEEIIDFIANSVKTNVRDILGILIHLEASWSLLSQDITIDSTKRVLKDVLNIEESPLTVENIIKFVCGKFEVKISDIMSDKRDKEISKTRQIAMYVSRELTGLSFPVIGRHFGGKNHTTVLQACKKTKEWLEKDPEINQTVTTIIRDLSI